jgi:hypothetical protein
LGGVELAINKHKSISDFVRISRLFTEMSSSPSSRPTRQEPFDQHLIVREDIVEMNLWWSSETGAQDSTGTHVSKKQMQNTVARGGI